MKIRLASPGVLRLRGAAIMALVGAFTGQAGTGLTLDTVFLSGQVIQRVGTSKAVPINGTCTGNPTTIQARVVDYATGTVVYTDWATVATSPAGGVWTGTITAPQGDGYRIQVRDGVNVALMAQSTNTFGVGAVIGTNGQSNMRHMPGTYEIAPLGSPRARAFNRAGAFYRIGNYNDSRPIGQQSNLGSFTAAAGDAGDSVRGDGFIFLANIIAETLAIPVCLIERASSGSSMAQWQPSLQTGLWNDFATALAASGGDMEAMIWYQGETDAHNMNAATHNAGLAAIHNQCMVVTGRTTSTFKFGIVTLGIGSFNSSTEGEFGAMRALLASYANNTAGAFLASVAHDSYTSDGVHLWGESLSRVGRRAAESYLAILGTGTSGAGPRITSASRSGTTVTTVIAHTGGTALMDGAGGTGTTLTGFQFFDAGAGGALITYTSAISGGVFVFTLANAPVGALTMSYAMMNNPHSASATAAPTLASIPCDNATYLNSSVGCPLQPLAAMAVS